jgi:hypothetical protein
MSANTPRSQGHFEALLQPIYRELKRLFPSVPTPLYEWEDYEANCSFDEPFARLVIRAEKDTKKTVLLLDRRALLSSPAYWQRQSEELWLVLKDESGREELFGPVSRAKFEAVFSDKKLPQTTPPREIHDHVFSSYVSFILAGWSFERLLEQNPDSWIHSGTYEAEFIAGSIKAYFCFLVDSLPPQISDSVWSRPWGEDKAFDQWRKKEAGVSFSYPLLKGDGYAAIKCLISTPLLGLQPVQIKEYFEQAAKCLEENPY